MKKQVCLGAFIAIVGLSGNAIAQDIRSLPLPADQVINVSTKAVPVFTEIAIGPELKRGKAVVVGTTELSEELASRLWIPKTLDWDSVRGLVGALQNARANHLDTIPDLTSQLESRIQAALLSQPNAVLLKQVSDPQGHKSLTVVQGVKQQSDSARILLLPPRLTIGDVLRVRIQVVNRSGIGTQIDEVGLSARGGAGDEFTFSVDRSLFGLFDLTGTVNDVSNAKLLDGTTKNVQEFVGTGESVQSIAVFDNISLDTVLSTEPKDAATKVDLRMQGRTLKYSGQWLFPGWNLGLVANQAFTNTSAVASIGVEKWLPIFAPGRKSTDDTPGSISTIALRVEYAHQLRRDSRFSVDSSLQDGLWVNGVLNIGPLYSAGGKAALFANAQGYYIPSNYHSFGESLNRSWLHYFDAGLMVPILQGDGGTASEQKLNSLWIKLSFTDGYNPANNFARTSSFKVELTQSFKF